MMEAIESSGSAISFQLNPMVAYQAQLGSGVIKKITLSNFATNAVKTSLFAQTYFTDPKAMAEKVLDYQTRYDDLNISSLQLSTVGNALFSYRYQSENMDRQSMEGILNEELTALDAFEIGMTKPNSYVWAQTDRYYQAPIESNKYAYITDSIPFISLVLTGSSALYSPYVNYVSDYDLMSLRLIEYGIAPSFLITYEPTHQLRYTNSEYIYTSEYVLWNDVMVSMGRMHQSATQAIESSHMISHRYILEGGAETIYANGVILYVNYSNADVAIDAQHSVPSQSYTVVMP
jgi:hypothetical protein